MLLKPSDNTPTLRLRLAAPQGGAFCLGSGPAAKNTPTLRLRLAALILCTMLLGVAGSAQAQLSGSAALASDYVWRGSSQTRERPAVQAGLKYVHSSGLYASAWGSNVRFAPDNGAASEFDFAAGWYGRLAQDWALDLYFLRYQYPGADTQLNWNEVNAALNWRDRWWLAIGRSTNAMASTTTGTYLLLGMCYPLDAQWRLEGTVARYFLDDTYADSYTHGSISAAWAFRPPFEARLTLHASDGAAKQLFPGMAGSRIELAVQAAF